MRTDGILSSLKHLLNWKLYKETYQEWSADKAGLLASSLAYHSAMAMAPLIIGVLALIGLVYDTKMAQLQLVAQVNHFVGPKGAEVVNTILSNADQPQLAKWAGVLSLLLLIWSASNIFAQVQDALNTAWGVKLRPDLPLSRKIQHRLLPLVIVLGIGIVLLAVSIGGALLTSIGSFFTDLLPGGALLWQILNVFVTVAVITILCACVFKWLPDVKISWQDLWPGSLLTALLFVLGQYLLGWYLGRQSSASMYGAAGSLIIVLLWLYYSAQIFLFGAEFTQVYATHYGHGVEPDQDAVGRDVGTPEKPVAEAANAANGVEPKREINAPVTAPQPVQASSSELSTSRLVTGLAVESNSLFQQEMSLAKAEIREIVVRVRNGVAKVAGGGVSLYTALLFILLAIALLLSKIMPLWLGLLLVGALVMIEGWILTLAGRKKLAETTLWPEKTLASIRQDGESIRPIFRVNARSDAR